MTDYDFTFKVIVLGDPGVGKSCLVKKYSTDVFEATYHQTIGIDFAVRVIAIDDYTVKLQLWDTAGQERFRSVVKSYMHGVSLVLYVFDLTNVQSFNNIELWHRDMVEHADRKVKAVLFGNKLDLGDIRVVSKEEAEEYARSHNMRYAEISVMEDTHMIAETVHLTVQDLIEDVMRERQKLRPTPRAKKVIRVEEPTPERGPNCC